jgi:MMP 1-O-methyltransferase
MSNSFGSAEDTRAEVLDDSDKLDAYVCLSERIPGWTRGAEARELSHISYWLPQDAILVEIGSFLGSGSILLAGPRRLRGSGIVHCIDPFDGSGDSFSVPIYRTILHQLRGGSQRSHFEANIRECDLAPWVEIHQGLAEQIVRTWTSPIDLLFLDGDQSHAGVRKVYDDWAPFLKIGGVIALHNSEPDNRRPDHDGHRVIAEQEIKEPAFRDVRLVSSTTIAVKAH